MELSTEQNIDESMVDAKLIVGVALYRKTSKHEALS